MSLSNTFDMLSKAQKNGYAVGAFNVENMEMAMAAVAAAEELSAPIILQTTPSTIKYGGLDTYVGMIGALAKNARIPIALHLDHGNTVELAASALNCGYTSIMIDGSKLPLNENIAITKTVVELCNARGIPVEGELGQVGGKEDDTECENAGYTIPSEAVLFERETGVSSIAVGVGTAHGIYTAEPVLNSELISELKIIISSPMVLHGASGISDDAIRDCIKKGICKVNFATELRIAYSDGVKELLRDKPNTFDPKTYGNVGIQRVKALVKEKIMVCGSNGKA